MRKSERLGGGQIVEFGLRPVGPYAPEGIGNSEVGKVSAEGKGHSVMADGRLME